MTMINDLRFDRDTFLTVGLQYKKIDARVHKLQDELDDSHDMVNHWKEKALHKAQKHHLQDMAAAILDDDPQKLEGSSKSAVSTATPSVEPKANKTTRIPDPDLFTDGKNPTWDDWSNKILDKLQINHDHYPTERSQILYIFNRLGGDAAKMVKNRRQINSPNAYLTVVDVITDLAETYEDIDRRANASREYNAMRHDTTMPFRDFYAKFKLLGRELNQPSADMMDDLMKKLSPRLKTPAVHQGGFDSMTSMKNYLIKVDN